MVSPLLDTALIERAVAFAMKALPLDKQTRTNASAIRKAIREAVLEGSTEEVELAQIGILVVE